MFQKNEEREVYLRISRLYKKKLALVQAKESQSRRKHPAVIRQDEVISLTVTPTTALEWIQMVTMLIFTWDADYQIALILEKALSQARYREYSGEWQVFAKMKTYFGLPQVPEKQGTKGYYPLHTVLQEELEVGWNEGSIFSPYYWTEFLQNFMFSEDDIFGNLVPSMVKWFQTVDIVSFEELTRRSNRRRVKEVQRHRGYRDKGSLRSEDSRARTKANIRPAGERNISIDPLPHVLTWGQKVD